MADGHRWDVFSRDGGYRISGGLPVVSVKGVRRHVGVDTCELVTPYSPDAYGRLAPSCGIIVRRDGVQQFSGMVGSSRRIAWDKSTGEVTITVQCLGDDVHLADRLVLPHPGRAPDAQTVDYWTYTGRASGAMWQLISQQAGPSALAARRVPTLTLVDDPNVGNYRDDWSVQFAPVLDTLAFWSVLSGDDLGVRITSSNDGLLAEVYLPRQLSSQVRFSANLRNLTGWDLEETPPTVTCSIAAGQGDLSARVRRYVDSTNPLDLRWGRRIERYLDQRDEADTTKLLQAAIDDVADGTGQVSLSIAASDTTSISYGDTWDLGDRVTVYVGLPGQPAAATIVDLVREVAFSVGASGVETITPAIGTSDAKAIRPGQTQQQLARVAAGLARLTRNK
jgi:Siphovirus ReqiPepy6 Gp37-like protein